MKRALTGIRPSGQLHLGNYLGTIKPALELQASYDCHYFIADLHSLNTLRDPKSLRSYSYDVAAAWIASGLDVTKHTLYRQSDLPPVTELAWYLSCVTGVGFLEKAHAYKDAASQNKDVNHGVFAYPVLMAADILIVDPDVVPVGQDQKQHVEMSRDMAGSFNAIFGEGILKQPEPLIREEVAIVPGVDGRKMSKSYDNVIPIFSDDTELKKRVMAIPTDSTPLEAAKEIEGTTIGALFKLFLSKNDYSDLAKRLSSGGLGWGHVKLEFFELLVNRYSEERKLYSELRSDTKELDKILKSGADKALVTAIKVINRVRDAVGLMPYPN